MANLPALVIAPIAKVGFELFQVGEESVLVAAILRGDAIAFGPPDGEQEHGQSVVVATAFADLPAPVEYRRGNPVDRAPGTALHRIGTGERRIPGGGEALGVGARAQAISGLIAHADGTRRSDDAAILRQRAHEGDLAHGRPSITAGTDGNRGEGVAHSPA